MEKYASSTWRMAEILCQVSCSDRGANVICFAEVDDHQHQHRPSRPNNNICLSYIIEEELLLLVLKIV